MSKTNTEHCTDAIAKAIGATEIIGEDGVLRFYHADVLAAELELDEFYHVQPDAKLDVRKVLEPSMYQALAEPCEAYQLQLCGKLEATP